jgi:hypothetical protein
MRHSFLLWLGTALSVVCSSSWAVDQDKRFVEIPSANSVHSFDLTTVQMIQSGRFAVVGTTVDNPDVMKLKLKVLATLRTFCGKPAGKYPAPADVFTLGPPDLPVESIEVGVSQSELSGKKYHSKMLCGHIHIGNWR